MPPCMVDVDTYILCSTWHRTPNPPTTDKENVTHWQWIGYITYMTFNTHIQYTPTHMDHGGRLSPPPSLGHVGGGCPHDADLPSAGRPFRLHGDDCGGDGDGDVKHPLPPLLPSPIACSPFKPCRPSARGTTNPTPTWTTSAMSRSIRPRHASRCITTYPLSAEVSSAL